VSTALLAIVAGKFDMRSDIRHTTFLEIDTVWPKQAGWTPGELWALSKDEGNDYEIESQELQSASRR